MNGRVGNDKGVGRYTCITENGCSVVDHVLCKSDLMKYFNSFSVGEPNISSDHCVINFLIGTRNLDTTHLSNEPCQPLEYIYRWERDEKDIYIEILSSVSIKEKLDSVYNDLQYTMFQDDIVANLNRKLVEAPSNFYC